MMRRGRMARGRMTLEAPMQQLPDYKAAEGVRQRRPYDFEAQVRAAYGLPAPEWRTHKAVWGPCGCCICDDCKAMPHASECLDRVSDRGEGKAPSAERNP